MGGGWVGGSCMDAHHQKTCRRGRCAAARRQSPCNPICCLLGFACGCQGFKAGVCTCMTLQCALMLSGRQVGGLHRHDAVTRLDAVRASRRRLHVHDVATRPDTLRICRMLRTYVVRVYAAHMSAHKARVFLRAKLHNYTGVHTRTRTHTHTYTRAH